MDKRKLIFIFSTVAVFSAVVVLFVFRRVPAGVPGTGPEVTIQPETTYPDKPPIPTGSPLDVVSVNPPDGSEGIATDSAITIRFSRAISPDEISFSMAPRTEYAVTIENSMLVVRPVLSPDTLYTYTIKFSDQKLLPVSYTFSTVIVEGLKPQDTFPEGAKEEQDEYYRANFPDIFLSNQVPFENQYFSVESGFNYSSGKFSFKVKPKIADAGKARDEFVNWLVTLGLESSQIRELEIGYD